MELYIRDNNTFALKKDGRAILSAAPGQTMVFAGCGEEDIEMNRGFFAIEDYIHERRALPLSAAEKTADGCVLDFGGEITIRLTLKGDLAELSLEQKNPAINRFWLRVRAEADEKVYGCGEQMSYLNLRGRHFPLWTSEPGIGRDKSTFLTWAVDNNSKAGGDYYCTNFPQPTYVSSRHYYLDVASTAYADFDFRREDWHELQLWEVPKAIRIEAAPTMPALMKKLTAFFGRQPMLPEWLYDGVVLGVQGGTERSFSLADRCTEHGVKLAGIWCQDWCGKRETSFGRRLDWNWEWNRDMYPGLPDKIKEYREKGVRFLAYVSPYLAWDGPLYQKAKEAGCFATAQDGSDYLVDFGEFYCGVIDFTKPEANAWFKDLIKKNLLGIGVSGWMADFGEYLPTDIKLANGLSPMLEHNHWPALWAKCNHDAVREAGAEGEAVYFMRAGAAGSQRWCPLMWAGDQSVDWTRHDGIGTALTAALSMGMSGCGLTHSDIGGYTSLGENVRSKELFLRWAEMNTFTPVMRTHESNRPDENFQVYDDDEALGIFAELSGIHVDLKPYIRHLVEENAQKGLPAQRALFLHYESEAPAWDIQTEYLFGRDLLVAPVLEPGKDEWKLWLPADEWVHLWTGKAHTGGEVSIAAPIGRPPVFYRAGSAFAELFATVGRAHPMPQPT